MSQTYYKAINWNEIEDVIDKSTWEKLTEQFWLDTRIPLSNDLDDWRKLSDQEKDLVGKVFGGLTLLDTMQSESGVGGHSCRCQNTSRRSRPQQYSIYGVCPRQIILFHFFNP